tara:strand:- start:240 stop:647 length:408 start_codon:yes stop_codon:yes gene_type:complete
MKISRTKLRQLVKEAMSDQYDDEDLMSGTDQGMFDSYGREKYQTSKRFTGGSIKIKPLSDGEMADSSDAYYELFDFLSNLDLGPGTKPSEKLKYALRWIATFEQGGAEQAAHLDKLKTDPQYRFAHGVKENKNED